MTAEEPAEGSVVSDEFAQWQEEATPDEVTVRVCLNRRLYREFTEASAALEALKADRKHATTLDDEAHSGDAQIALMQRVVDLEQAIRDAEKPMVFRCLHFREWKELAAKHPPTKEQREASPHRPPEVNEDTFYPAAVAATCVSPGLSTEQALWLREFLPRAKWWEIAGAIEQANVGGSEVPKSVSSIVAQLKRGLSSITAAPEESPSPSSGDESPNPESPTG